MEYIRDIENCPYAKEICGVPICMLNVEPCEKVDVRLCNSIIEKEEKE